MFKFFGKLGKKALHSPGSLIHIGEEDARDTIVQRICFNDKEYKQEQVQDLAQCSPEPDRGKKTWLMVSGLKDIQTIENLGQNYGIHPLVMEDIVNTQQRPKVEDYGNYIFVIAKTASYNRVLKRIESTQIAFILLPDTLLTFQEKEDDVFNYVLERIRKKRGRIGQMGTDYLLYALLDAVVDHYFFVLEGLGEEVETLEAEITEDPTPDTRNMIFKLKREMIFLRRSIWPMREVINGLLRSDIDLIKSKTEWFFRDLHDHAIQVVEILETFNDMTAGLGDLYLSSIGHKTNEVMKVLTIIATIFIPLTFIAGIYGMNFEFMPELKWKFGYFFVWGIMALVSAGMIWYFRRRKWF